MKKIIFLVLFSVFMLPGVLLAQSGGTQNPPPGSPSSGGTQNPPPGGTTNPNIINPVITNPLKIGSDIPSIIAAVMKGIVMPLAAVLVVLAIVYSGFKFVMAQGNSTELQKAREGLVWVLVGSAILLGAYGISEVLKTTINQVVGTSV